MFGTDYRLPGGIQHPQTKRIRYKRYTRYTIILLGLIITYTLFRYTKYDALKKEDSSQESRKKLEAGINWNPDPVRGEPIFPYRQFSSSEIMRIHSSGEADQLQPLNKVTSV